MQVPLVEAPRWYQFRCLKQLQLLETGSGNSPRIRNRYEDRPYGLLTELGEAASVTAVVIVGSELYEELKEYDGF